MARLFALPQCVGDACFSFFIAVTGDLTVRANCASSRGALKSSNPSTRVLLGLVPTTVSMR